MNDPATYSISEQNDSISPACLEHMERYLFTNNLEITGKKQQDAQTEKYSGKADLWNLECTVECLMMPGPPLMLLCAQPETKDWSFGDCFPQMPGTQQDGKSPSDGNGEGDPLPEAQGPGVGFFLSQLGLQTGLFIYAYAPAVDKETVNDREARIAKVLETMLLWRNWSSTDARLASELVPVLLDGGVLMVGNLSPAVLRSSPFGRLLVDFMALPVDWFESKFPALATIEYQGILPELNVQLPLVDQVKFGPAKMEEAHFALASPIYPWPDCSQLILECTIEILDTRLRIEADLPLEGDTITASASLLSGQQKLFKSPDPRLFPDLGSDESLKIELVFSISKLRLERISLAAILHEWKVLPEPFEFKELALSVLVLPQTEGAPLITASFLADILLGEIGLTFSGFYPGGRLTCSLDPDTPLKLRDIGNSFGIKDLLPDLSITQLGFSYEFQGGGTSGVLYISSTDGQDGGAVKWPHKALQDIHFRFEGPPYIVEVGARLQVGGALLTLSGVRSPEGWHFEGSTGPGQELSMAQLIEGLNDLFRTGMGDVPAAISSLSFYDLSLVYDTSAASKFAFKGNASLEVDGTAVKISVDIDVSGSQKEFGAQVTIGGEQFTVKFDEQKLIAGSDQNQDYERALIALYEHDSSQGIPAPNLRYTVRQLSPGLSVIVPAIEIHKAIFGYHTQRQKNVTMSAWLFGIELGGMNFSIGDPNLPIVSALLGRDLSFGVESPQLLLTTHVLTREALARLPSLGEKFKLPEADLNAASFSANLNLASEKYPLMLNLGEGQEKETESDKTKARESQETIPPDSSLVPTARMSALAAQETQETEEKPPPSGEVTWIKVQKHIGVLYFEKIGVRYKDDSLCLLLGASLTASGLTIALDGFSIHSPLDRFQPKFDLNGLSISYKADPVEVSGAFLKDEQNGDVQYSGQALIKAKSFMLSAIGSYTSVGGNPSLFIFAYLDMPLGGPPCFFVTGLAAGFGYYSSLRIPAIEEVKDFPLLAAMVDPSEIGGKDASPGAVLKSLRNWIRPQPGAYWLAVGISFRSFEIIKSDVLAIVEFGQEFQVLALGFSTIKLPQEGHAYLFAELMIKITIKPAEGVISAMALLTANSYLLDPACHLTGGFAFFIWFGDNPHAGDFVLTIGGYHPTFRAPAWYPQVPRLGFNWPVSSTVTIKGEAYFALTSSCVMAGGSLEVLFHSGNLQAWFIAHADVIIYWKPFYFEASISVRIGASYRIKIWFVRVTLSVELGATVELWGPPTGGKAHINWFIISFTVSFGAGKLAGARTVDWDGFKTMLPQKNNGNQASASQIGARRDDSDQVSTDPDLSVIQITVNDGLLQQVDGENGKKDWIIRPDEFAFSIETAVPLTEVHLANPVDKKADPILLTGCKNIGIRPMGIKSITSLQTVTVQKSGKSPATLPFSEWDHTPQTRSMPEAMWGSPVVGSLKAEANLIENCLVGVKEIKLKPHIDPGGPPKFKTEEGFTYFPIDLQADGKEYPDYMPLSTAASEPEKGHSTSSGSLTLIQETFLSPVTVKKRTAVFKALKGLGVTTWSNGDLDELKANPAIGFNTSPMIGNPLTGSR